MIHNVPIILKKWSPDANLIIEDLTKVPMWVKLHNVPMAAFTSDGFSIGATKLGNPIVLDSYTSSMCEILGL
uniref:Zinc knuckle CX2CX4HX4C n=1 Tax=Tanacetum cinerariifolium TaxID=118510 RepID=A0A699WEL0_TANCI|nr:zinc knuckle CX2CX4HX4C [Tanacetum cinerariifolium]